MSDTTERSSQTGADRRKHQRFLVEVMLEDIFQLDAFVSKEKGKVINISRGGIAFLTKGMYKSDSDLVFSLMLPNGMKLVDVKGRVARVQKEAEGEWFHGIEFTELGLWNSVKLKWFLSRQPASA